MKFVPEIYTNLRIHGSHLSGRQARRNNFPTSNHRDLFRATTHSVHDYFVIRYIKEPTLTVITWSRESFSSDNIDLYYNYYDFLSKERHKGYVV